MIAQISGMMEGSMNFLNTFFSKIVIAIVVLLIGFIIGRSAERLITRVLHELEVDATFSKVTKKRFGIEKNLGKIVAYVIYLITIILALKRLGLTSIVLTVIAVGAVLFLVVSLLLGIKDFLPNLVAGFFIYRRKILAEGDKVQINDIRGKVTNFSLVETKIEKKNGDIIFIPNSKIIKSEVVKLKGKKR